MNALQKFGIAVAVVVVAVLTGWTTFTFNVGEYERTVVTRFGQFVSVEGPGLHFRLPIVNSTYPFRVDLQDLSTKTPENTYTVDNQEVDVIWRVRFRIPADKVEFVYKNARDYRALLEATAIDRLKKGMGKVNINDLSKSRDEVATNIKNVVAAEASQFGLQVVDFQIPNLEYTRTSEAADDAASQAKAGVETREQELEQARKTAERARVEAGGKADAYLLERRAEATAIELKGKAEAAAIKAQTDALAQNAALVELKKAEKWDGQLPKQFLSNVVPFMSVDQTASQQTANTPVRR